MPIETVKLIKRTYLSAQHLHASEFLATKARTMQDSYQVGGASPPIDSFRQEYRSFVLASLFASVAFVEARINEFFATVRISCPGMR